MPINHLKTGKLASAETSCAISYLRQWTIYSTVRTITTSLYITVLGLMNSRVQDVFNMKTVPKTVPKSVKLRRHWNTCNRSEQ